MCLMPSAHSNFHTTAVPFLSFAAFFFFFLNPHHALGLFSRWYVGFILGGSFKTADKAQRSGNIYHLLSLSNPPPHFSPSPCRGASVWRDLCNVKSSPPIRPDVRISNQPKEVEMQIRHLLCDPKTSLIYHSGASVIMAPSLTLCLHDF